MRIVQSPVYLQAYNTGQRKFEEFSDTNIANLYISGNIYSDNPFYQYGYSGLYIPYFAIDEIYAAPVRIGRLLGNVGPGINIGEYNVAESPYSIRVTGDGGEITIGELNFLVSGRENSVIGYRNRMYSTKRIFSYGKQNVFANSDYILNIGAANYISGQHLSNIFGKSNTIYAENNIDDFKGNKPVTFSGYNSLRLTMVGDYNTIISGVDTVASFGNNNVFSKVVNVLNYGNNNFSKLTSGSNNMMIGYRNDLSNSFDGSSIGNENTLTNANGDFLVGLSNNVNQSYYNYIFGSRNNINSGFTNLIVGTNNQITNDLHTVLGNNNQINSRSIDNTIIGENNLLSGTINSYIFGSNNVSDKSILANIYGISYTNGITRLLGPYSGSSGLAGDNNYYIGNGNESFLNTKTIVLGESNQLVDNTRSYLIGSSNRLINNNSSYVFGFNNRISGSANAIFVGYNFASGNNTISGVGIKITPSGIDIYGRLRVNGITLNIP